MNWKTAIAAVIAVIALRLLSFYMDATMLLVTLAVVLLTGIPFWMWLGAKRALARQAREKDKTKKETATVTETAAVPEKKETAKTKAEPTSTNRSEWIARKFWFFSTPMFWLLLVLIVLLFYWLNEIGVLNISGIPWPEFTEGLRLALFLILMGLVLMVLIWRYLGSLLLALGVAILLLTFLQLNPLSWVSSSYGTFFPEWATLEVAPNSVGPSISITAHKNFCVRIVGAPDTPEFILSHTEIVPWGSSEWCPNDGGSFRKIRFVGSNETYTAQYKIQDAPCSNGSS